MPVSTAPIDWVARWHALVQARHEQGRRLDSQHRRADAWAGRAQRFNRFVAETGATDPLLQRLLKRVDARTTVLDVGAGPGRHTIPLADVAGQVTAVEPSAAMRELLAQNVDAAGLANVRIVDAEWPGAPVEPADVVVCAHVLYGTDDVEPFLRALDAATRQSCYVVMRLGQREGAYLPAFEQVWGEPRALAPSVLDLLNVAHQLGFPANLEVVPFQAWRSFDSFEEAFEHIRAEVLNPADESSQATIRAFLRERLTERDGRIGLYGDTPRAGIVWWDKT